MPFEFINNNATIDRASRKRIRSRAATGKNSNRTCTRSSKANTLKNTAVTPFKAPTSLYGSHRAQPDEGVDVVAEIRCPVDDGLQFPRRVHRESRYLVREALFFFANCRHNPQLDGAVVMPDNMRSVWVQLFFQDEAYFHCWMAISILCSKSRVNEPERGVRHITHTYHLVQERLYGKEATSDMTIAVLVNMSQYERLQEQYERGFIHVQGLYRMVQLRGGMMKLSRECWGIAQKLLRADLEYAIQLGSRTLFGDDGIRALCEMGFPCVGFGEQSDSADGSELDLFLRQNLRPDLWAIFADMRRLGMMLNGASAGREQKLDGVDVHCTIILLGYRLLQINPLDDALATVTSDLENVIHLSLLAFLVTFLTGLDHRILDKPILSRRLRLAINKLSTSTNEGQEGQMVQSVLIWGLCIGSAAVFKYSEDEWLNPRTQTTMQALGLYTWEDTKKVLAGFPWVVALHDRAAIALSSTQTLLRLSNTTYQLF
ncbi:hypothetical protein BJX63DRAFT_311578 [Aspergillus granulosus]|uniref:Uncharacterized protein n=1 Tax=Aspergillus granulosus TaxID=176169 RepID=A0ABR4HXY2_9EURO